MREWWTSTALRCSIVVVPSMVLCGGALLGPSLAFVVGVGAILVLALKTERLSALCTVDPVVCRLWCSRGVMQDVRGKRVTIH